MAEALTAVTGLPVEFVDVPDEGARPAMMAAGLPDFVADQLVEIFRQLRQSVGAEVTDTVERLTGSPPRDSAAFARDHARVFESATVAAGR